MAEVTALLYQEICYRGVCYMSVTLYSGTCSLQSIMFYEFYDELYILTEEKVTFLAYFEI